MSNVLLVNSGTVHKQDSMRFNLKKLTFTLIPIICFCLLLSYELFEQTNYFIFQGNTAEEENSSSLSYAENNCLHFVVVCIGAKTRRYFFVLLKSLLLNRNHQSTKVHLHVFTKSDEISSLTETFSSWSAPNFIQSYYDAESLHSYVNWIPSTHYSSINGLLKLAIGELLPESVEQAVLIDTDMVFLEEITEMKLIFDAMRLSNASIGLVAEYTFYYQGESNVRWITPISALQQQRNQSFSKTGINSGLVLIDFARLKNEELHYNSTGKNNRQFRSAYTRLAMGVAEKFLKHITSTKTGDQDIINAMVAEHPQLFYSIDLKWNYQHCCFIPNHENRCPGPLNVAKILHWIAPVKVFEMKETELVAGSNGAKLNTDGLKGIQLFKLYDQIVGYIQVSKEDAKFKFTGGFKHQQQGNTKEFENLLMHVLSESTVALNITQLAAFKAYQIIGKIVCYNQVGSLKSESYTLAPPYQLHTFNLNMNAIGNRSELLVATTLINLPNSIMIGCAFASAANQ